MGVPAAYWLNDICDHVFWQALEMFTSMRMFDEAKQWAEIAARSGQLIKGAAGAASGGTDVAELMNRQAEWSEETANYEAAAEMYIKVPC